MRTADRHSAKTPVDALLTRYARDGYVIVERALDPADVAAIRAELTPILDAGRDGRNDFEGHRTRRVYALLAKAPTTAILVEHPLLLAMLDRLMSPGFLLSADLAIELREGETVQPWHVDDGFYRVPRPRPALGVSAIWAIDDFTEDNGSTELIPGSHLWGEARPTGDEEAVRATMPAGSLLLFAGTLWHRGGANRTPAPRLAVTPQFCEPWCRQQENMMLAVGDAARGLSDRVRAMLGYSIHPPFMGHVDGMHPLRLLDRDYDSAATGDGERARRLLERDGYGGAPEATTARA
ncbi:MAG: phytanoyl-CoA dioxygenase family protein [Caulobacteraceae bacterium]|nr:phytanoyl-CoA dioxygenase family protein [Caulobacteraceae bacterium]